MESPLGKTCASWKARHLETPVIKFVTRFPTVTPFPSVIFLSDFFPSGIFVKSVINYDIHFIMTHNEIVQYTVGGPIKGPAIKGPFPKK